jgi:hypothetical protein
MDPLRKCVAILVGVGLATTVSAAALGQTEGSPGQMALPGDQAASTEAAISETTVTARGHQVAAGGSAGNLEGASCPTDFKMLSGSCHPGYTNQVRIINQYPNIALNAWRCGFKNNTSSNRSVWVYTLCGKGGLPDIVEHRLQIRRFTTTTLTNADADRILGDATTTMQTNDGPGDVACGVSMVRDGNVATFSTGDGSIDSSAEFSTLIGLPGWIKAVNQINWCGGLIPNVIGCAPVPGSSLAVVRFQASLEGILWAHEFGHNKGLSHRNDDPNAIMNGTISSSRLRMTQAECDAFRTAPLIALASQEVMPAAGESSLMPVEDFVRQIFIHGVPYDQASQYGPDAVPKLLEMLNDPAEEAWWPNIVVVLGMIGDPSVVDPMISFIEEEMDGELSREHYIAKTSALMSLGYVVNKTGNQKALDYLKASINPTTWQDKDVGQAPFQASTTERSIDFSKHAILGLALSGHPEAEQALRSLQQAPADTELGRAFQAQVDELVSEALDEHRRIAREGLDEYYETTQ